MDLAGTFSSTTTSRSKMRRLRARLRFLFLAILAVAAAVIGWTYLSRPPTVDGEKATRGLVADVVYATGFVEPRRPSDISSRVTAPVTAVLVQEGGKVRKGQALAVLDAEDQRHTIEQLAAARINAAQEESRSLMLFKQGWVTKSARDQAVASADAARAAEASARAKLDQYTIRAGVGGVILRRDVEPGDLATASKTLFEIGDPKQLRVTATVDERDIPLVHTGTVALMSTEAYPGRVFRGQVYEITPGGDPDQRAFRVRIRPDATLPVGLTLEVNVVVAKRPHALLAPAAAIRDNQLWLVMNQRATKVSIATGIRGSERTEITRGVSEGDCILASAPANLKDGQRVIVKGC